MIHISTSTSKTLKIKCQPIQNPSQNFKINEPIHNNEKKLR